MSMTPEDRPVTDRPAKSLAPMPRPGPSAQGPGAARTGSCSRRARLLVQVYWSTCTCPCALRSLQPIFARPRFATRWDLLDCRWDLLHWLWVAWSFSNRNALVDGKVFLHRTGSWSLRESCTTLVKVKQTGVTIIRSQSDHIRVQHQFAIMFIPFHLFIQS